MFALLTASAVSLIAASGWAAENYTVTTGAEGLSYNRVYGTKLAEKAAEVGLQLRTVESTGSVQNLDRLEGEEVALGITQGDVYGARTDGDEYFAETVLPVGVLGIEHVMCAVSKNGRLRDFAAFIEDEGPNPPFKVSVPAGTGTAFTLETWMARLPNMSQNVTLVTEPEGKEYNRMKELRLVTNGKRDAVCVVTTADPLATDGFIGQVNADPQLGWLAIRDDQFGRAFTASLERVTDANGRPMYTVTEATVNAGTFGRAALLIGSGEKITTVATPVLLVGNFDVITNQKDLERLVAVVRDDDLLGTDTAAGIARKRAAVLGTLGSLNEQYNPLAK